jgi:hypothetical protein
MAATLTPFEVAQNRQWIFISGLLLMHVVDELITRGEECRKGAQDIGLPLRERAEALRESRNINTQLSIVAQVSVWPGHQEMS